MGEGEHGIQKLKTELAGVELATGSSLSAGF